MQKRIQKKKAAGFVVTAELLLVTTILGIGLITGFTVLRDQTISELDDTASAIGSINQSYTIEGTNWTTQGGNTVSEVSGFAYNDQADLGGGNVGGDNASVDYKSAPTASQTTSAAGEANLN